MMGCLVYEDNWVVLLESITMLHGEHVQIGLLTGDPTHNQYKTREITSKSNIWLLLTSELNA